MHTPPPHLSLRARRRNPDGAELAVDVAARGWPAIAGVALLALWSSPTCCCGGSDDRALAREH